jgi:hypothetical protein
MRDPERLLRNPPSPIARLLLRAYKEEKPSAAALRRTERAAVAAAVAGTAVKSASAAAAAGGVKLAAAGGASGLAAATAGGSSAPAGAALALGTIAKWFGIGALGGVLAAPLVKAIGGEPTSKQPLAASAAPAHSAAPGARAPERARSPLPLPPPENSHELSAASAVAPATALAPSPAPGDPPTAESSTRTSGALLAAEVEFVDRGQSALQRGAFDEALARLAPYERRFPREQLLTEVLFLRMEAFSRSGNADQARALAARIVTRGVTGPQAARAREVLAR